MALVEFALILPALAILVFGTIDFARAYFTYEQVKNAAREGANYAQFFPYQVSPSGANCPDPSNILFRARSESGSSGGVDSGISVSVNPKTPNGTSCDLTDAPPAAGTVITVTATKPFALLTPLVSQFININTVSSSVSIVEQ